jgi:TIR domain
MSERRQLQHIRVFLSSPGDVAEERALARHLLKDELPYDPFLKNHFSFEVVSWDDPAASIPMLAASTPQEAVNRFGLKPSDCDLVIVVLWSRMGTPLKIYKPTGEPYKSGTEWEFEDALNAWPQPGILVYRRMERPKVELTDPKLQEKSQQYKMVEQFFGRFDNPDGSLRGGVTAYNTPAEFRERLANDLRFILRERLRVAPLAAERGIPVTSLRAILARFGENEEVPEQEILARLTGWAEEYAAVRKALHKRFQWAPPKKELLSAETPPANPRKLRAFLCHAKENKDDVKDIYSKLLEADVDPWLDEKSIMPGKKWEYEITKAIRDTDAILVFLSNAAISKTGYVHKEIGQALNITDEQPEGRIFIIPVRLEDCQVPARLASIQYVDYFNRDGHKMLLSALQDLSIWLNQNGNIVRSILQNG